MPYYPPPSTGSGSPGGSNTQVQYNNSSAFGGISGATSNGTNIFIPTLYGSSSASGTLTLRSTTDSTKGTIGLDDLTKLWDSIPDDPGTKNILTFDASFADSSGGASINGYYFNPTVTTSGTLALNQLTAVKGAGSYTYGTNPSFGNLFQLFVAQPSCTLNVAAGVSNNWTLLSQQEIITGSTIAAGSTNGFYGFQENSRVGSTGAAGSIGFTHVTAFAAHLRMQAVTGGGSPSVTTITDLRGLWVKDVAKSGSGTNTVTRQTAIDVENISGGTTNVVLQSALTSGANNYFLRDTGGAQCSFAGKFTTYNNIATVSNGVPSILAEVNAVDQTAAIATSTLYAVPSSGAGAYRISWHAIRNRAATTSSTLGALTITYTDSDGVSRAITATGQNSAGTMQTTNTTNSATTTGSTWGHPLVIYASASTNIQYAYAYASSGGTSMRYNLRIRLEAL